MVALWAERVVYSTYNVSIISTNLQDEVELMLIVDFTIGLINCKKKRKKGRDFVM